MNDIETKNHVSVPTLPHLRAAFDIVDRVETV